MADYSTMSDADLLALVQPKTDYAKMSDADLLKLIGKPQSSELPVATSADVAKSAGVGVGKGFIGLAGLPGDLAELGARGIDRATQWVGGKLGVDVKPRADAAPTYGSGDIRKAVEGYTGEFYKPQSTAGRYAETVGEFAPGLIGGGGVGALARRAITQVAAPGLASEAAGQATAGTAAEPYARVAGAVAGGLAPTIAGRLVTPLPSSAAREALVQNLADEGVTSLTAGQRTGRPALRYAESVFGDYPGAGSQATRMQGEAQDQFTRAVMRRAGQGLEDATPETLAANQARLGGEFRGLAARNDLTFDPQFVTDASRSIRNYERVPPSQQRAMVEGYVNDIVDHMNTGVMPGPYYQEMRSRLSRQANGLRVSDPTLSDTLRGLRTSLDDAMGRSITPADRQAWAQARTEYGAQKTIEKAASKAGEAIAEGQITPAALRVAIPKTGGGYARGEGQLSELARSGSGVMGQMPQSGTGPRVLAATLMSALGGTGAGSIMGAGPEALAAAMAGAAAPAFAGRALMSRPVQGYLGNQVAAPILNAMNPRREAAIAALLALQQRDSGPLRITVHPRTPALP